MGKRDSLSSNKTMKMWTIVILVILVAFLFTKYISSASASTPTQSYMEYKKDFDAMNTFDDYVEVARKHGTYNYINETEFFRESLKVIPEDMRRTLISLVKSVPLSYAQLQNEKIIEQISGNIAILSVNTKEGKSANIIMVKENGVWKVSKDDWRNPKTVQ